MAKTNKSAIFKGISVVGVDDKGRMAMPSKYRDALMACCRGDLVVTVDKDGCLLIYPANEWAPLEKQLLALPPMDKQSRLVQRLLIGHATECAMDKQGRLLLPPALRTIGGIVNRNAVLLGQGKKFELWDQKNWAKRCDTWLTETEGEQSGVTEVLQKIQL